MAEQRSLFSRLGAGAAWAQYLPPLPSKHIPQADKPPKLNALQTRIIAHLDAWGIRSIPEIREDIPGTPDSVRWAVGQLREMGIVAQDSRTWPKIVDLWHLTAAGHVVADQLAKAGVEAPPIGAETAPDVPATVCTPDLEEAIRLYTTQKWGLRKVSKATHISYERLAMLLRAAGVKVRPRGVNANRDQAGD